MTEPSVQRALASRRKERGAFYTPPALATALARWAIQSPGDKVLDPSFGALTLLDAGQERLRELGAEQDQIATQLFGVELDDDAFGSAVARTWTANRAPTLVHTDFLAVRPGQGVPAVDVVIGNPPYLRYQGFNARNGCFPGLATAAASVELTRLASSWAPFIVHAVRFVEAGGRLAHVLPAQLLHAQYARPVIDFLCQEFRQVTVVAFEERVFPAALEEVVILCATDRGAGPARIAFSSVRRLEELDLHRLTKRRRRPRCAGDQRGKLLAELLPRRTRALYTECEDTPGVKRLGEICEVNIGTVTGANSFFLLSDDQAANFAPALFVPAIGKAIHVLGARFSERDYDQLRSSGAACRLLLLGDETPAADLATVRAYLEEGEAERLHERTKCRSRAPWWAIKVPRRPVPDLFLTYCAHRHPRLVLNQARVTHTNTLHGVVVTGSASPRVVAAGFYNSLTMLSAELLARSYGGGVLKLEPTEAEALLMPPLEGLGRYRGLLSKIDGLIRARSLDQALDLVDAVVLGHGLGLEEDDIAALRKGAERLRSRRFSRRREPRR